MLNLRRFIWNFRICRVFVDRINSFRVIWPQRQKCGFTPAKADFFFLMWRFDPPLNSRPMGRRGVIFFVLKPGSSSFIWCLIWLSVMDINGAITKKSRKIAVTPQVTIPFTIRSLIIVFSGIIVLGGKNV